jgi:hypothetical protein
LFEGGGASRRKAIEALVALFLLAPFADQQSLGFEAAQQRVKSALFDVDAVGGEGFTQGVAIVLLAKLGENGQDEAAATELEAEVLEDGLEGFIHTALHTLYDAQCTASSRSREFFEKTFFLNFTSGVPVKEETLEVRVLRDLSLLVKSKKVQPAVSDEGGDRVYR